MRRKLAFDGATRPRVRMITSIACMVFVASLAIAFWAGALWIANVLLGLR